jgi:beta-phosphoglucomutase-like phosphatase (HAD superfamily)
LNATLDDVSIEWRLALDAARKALLDAGRCGSSVPFERRELNARTARLARERAQIARLLDAVAAEERIHLLHPLSAPPASKRALGLPDGIAACVFDLEGVLIGSATVHEAAWAETFDTFLPRWAERGRRFAPIPGFGDRDYRLFIHGRPRLEGVQGFLASRGIRLPEGHSGDKAGAPTVWGLANRKSEAFRRRLERDGVAGYEGALLYLEEAHEAGVTCAVVSASANTRAVLARAGLAGVVDVIVDGNTVRDDRLRPLPAPDTLVAACERLAVPPAEAAIFETTPEGIDAARAAGSAFVVGVDRHGETLRRHGADAVVTDLAALLTGAAEVAGVRR